MSDAALVATTVSDGKSVVHYRLQSTLATGLTTRRTPPLFGLGLIEESDALVGTMGVRAKFLGALAEHESIEQAVIHAVVVELGLSTPDVCNGAQLVTQRTCLPDISEQELRDLVHYVRYLAAPPRPNTKSKGESVGLKTFHQIGCAACHRPTFSTMRSQFPLLRARSLEGYTDFSVHDVGGEYKVRTTPLWGLNSYGPPYWHDGSAQSIDEAIRLHDGQAAAVRHNYEALSNEQREALLDFLKGL